MGSSLLILAGVLAVLWYMDRRGKRDRQRAAAAPGPDARPKP